GMIATCGDTSGSSPRVRGEGSHVAEWASIRRFIPACAGRGLRKNTKSPVFVCQRTNSVRKVASLHLYDGRLTRISYSALFQAAEPPEETSEDFGFALRTSSMP